MANLTRHERRVLEEVILADLQVAEEEGAHEVYLDALLDVPEAVGDTEELTLREALQLLRTNQ